LPFVARTKLRSIHPRLSHRSCCVTGCWASRCRPRGEVCWPVSVDVVVTVDMSGGISLESVFKPPPPRPLTDRWRHGLEKSLAGDAFGGLRRTFGHRGDHGAVCHREPESGGENPGRMAVLYRAEGDAGRGTPDIKRREEEENGDREEKESVQHWCRWRSAYVLNWGRQKC